VVKITGGEQPLDYFFKYQKNIPEGLIYISSFVIYDNEYNEIGEYRGFMKVKGNKMIRHGFGTMEYEIKL